MDDQGAGGSFRRDDIDPAWGPRRPSSLPPTLHPHLRYGLNFPEIVLQDVPDRPNHLARPHSQGHGQSLPPPDNLLRETESTPDHDSVISVSSRSQDTSLINHVSVANADLRIPRSTFPGSPPQQLQPPTGPSRPSSGVSGLFMEDAWRLSHPRPQRLERLPSLLDNPSYQGNVRVTWSWKSDSPSRSRTDSSFAGDLNTEGQSEIRSLYHAGSMGKPPAIEAQEAAQDRKRAQIWPEVRKEAGPSTGKGASPSLRSGATNPTRKKPSTKVPVACDFCRKRKLKCDGGRPCSSCSARHFECAYQPGAPRRRGPGRAPKKTRAETTRLRQQLRQQQQRRSRHHHHPDQGQMSISEGSPGPAGPSLITTVPNPGFMRAGGLLAPGGGPRFPSQSPGASTSEMETGSQAGRKRRLSESSVEEPERKRSRIRDFGRERSS